MAWHFDSYKLHVNPYANLIDRATESIDGESFSDATYLELPPAMPFKDIPLNDGTKVCLVPPNLLFPSEHPIQIPAIAFGTGSALYHKDATAYVAQALENGFSHLDTAQGIPFHSITTYSK